MTLADFAHLSAVLASLQGLSAWARATSTRAWGEPADAPRSSRHRHRTWVLSTLLLQGCTALATGQWVDALALVAAAWMVLGGTLVLAMNQWPAATRLWAPRLGWLGVTGCVVVLGAALLPVGGRANIQSNQPLALIHKSQTAIN
jgi:Trk-type K+ transport system membrane component